MCLSFVRIFNCFISHFYFAILAQGATYFFLFFLFFIFRVADLVGIFSVLLRLIIDCSHLIGAERG